MNPNWQAKIGKLANDLVAESDPRAAKAESEKHSPSLDGSIKREIDVLQNGSKKTR